MSHVFTTLETLAVTSVESMQVRDFARVLEVLSDVLHRLPTAYQSQVEGVVRRILPGLSVQILTAELENTLEASAIALTELARSEAAHRVEAPLQGK